MHISVCLLVDFEFGNTITCSDNPEIRIIWIQIFSIGIVLYKVDLNSDFGKSEFEYCQMRSSEGG